MLKSLLIVLTCGFVTIAQRFVPFVIFNKREMPEWLKSLGRSLPKAIMTFLVIYCLKDIKLSYPGYGLPEAIGILLCVGLHLYKRNTLLSIAVSTIVYMLLVQNVFI